MTKQKAGSTNLLKYKKKYIIPGNVLRFPATYPYEDIVEMMIVDNYCEDWPYNLLVTTGYKAGHILKSFDKTWCHAKPGHKQAILKDLLTERWHTIYPDCDVSDVMIIEHYVS